jgi:hypothetical protein
MVREIQRWDDREVVTPVPRPENVKTIKTKWVYDLKLDGSGDLMRRRARGVVKGFTQKLGEHYFESFAAVVKYDSVRMLFAIIAAGGWTFGWSILLEHTSMRNLKAKTTSRFRKGSRTTTKFLTSTLS